MLREARALLARTDAVIERRDRPDPVAWVECALGITLDDWQKRIMRSTSQTLLALCARQVGKSTTCGARAAFDTAVMSNEQSIVIAPSFRQSKLLAAKIAATLRSRDVSFVATEHELRLSNGSSIIVLPGDQPDLVRGFTVTRGGSLIVDEAAYVKKSLWSVVLPMIAATGGRLVCLTSPAGPSGPIFEMAHDNSVEVVQVRATQLPRFDQSLVEQLRGRLGEHRARIELDAEFGTPAGGIFDPAVLAAMFAPRVRPPDEGDIEPEFAKQWEADRRRAIRERERAMGIPLSERTA